MIFTSLQYQFWLLVILAGVVSAFGLAVYIKDRRETKRLENEVYERVGKHTRRFRPLRK